MTHNARPDRRSTAPGRALLAFGLGTAVLALGMAAFAIVGRDGERAILVVDDVVAAAPPSTIAPLAPAPTIVPTITTSDLGTTTESSVATTSTVPLSPLSALVGERGSAIPPVIEPRVRPTGLVIENLDLDGAVRDVGLRDDGALEVPDATEIGWYRYGAAPGQEGATVLAAHVTWNGDLGPFLELGELEPGARVDVALDDGTTRTYEVVERTMYDKDALPRERIWRTTGPETLVLITCGGDFNPDIRRYRQNIVVYAVPVA